MVQGPFIKKTAVLSFYPKMGGVFELSFIWCIICLWCKRRLRHRERDVPKLPQSSRNSKGSPSFYLDGIPQKANWWQPLCQVIFAVIARARVAKKCPASLLSNQFAGAGLGLMYSPTVHTLSEVLCQVYLLALIRFNQGTSQDGRNPGLNSRKNKYGAKMANHLSLVPLCFNSWLAVVLSCRTATKAFNKLSQQGSAINSSSQIGPFFVFVFVCHCFFSTDAYMCAN